jgi:isopentenyl diphosphate isomerase/L-lactate dehydrogenase-like FMN-dependent dehydrogenase
LDGHIYGVSAPSGSPVVERVLEIMRAETRAAMQQIGAPSIKDLTPATVGKG